MKINIIIKMKLKVIYKINLYINENHVISTYY